MSKQDKVIGQLAPGGVALAIARVEEQRGRDALKVLELMTFALGNVTALGDFIYEIRERTGSWDDSRVKAWGQASDLAIKVMRTHTVVIPEYEDP